MRRYNINELHSNIKENNLGNYVKYTDHKAVLEIMQNKIDELEDEKKNLLEFVGDTWDEKQKELNNRI